MALIHDLAEIDTGDVFSFDAEGRIGKYEREQAAMQRLLALLPKGAAQELGSLWHEYEAAETPEARFAQAMDKLQPVIQNLILGGRIWKDFHITEDMARARKMPHLEGSPFLSGLFEMLLEQVRG